jgi:hypothetical protein
MPTSEARILANRANAARSTGPKTAEGKEQSRRNGLKHGLSGEGIVVPEEDVDPIDRRAQELQADLKPKSPLGKLLVLQMAMLSIRMERSVLQEFAAIAGRVRHACTDFDEERFDEAERLFDGLGETPRINLRKLRRSPEGVDRLIVAWQELRSDLTRDPNKPVWTAAQLELAANLTGLRSVDARASRLGALSRGVWGDFHALADHEGGDLDDTPRKAWALSRLRDRIDTEIESLQSHRETLDFAMIEIDRLEAPDRALFDPSKEATLARRYESEASRRFSKTLKDFRQAEAEYSERATAAPAPIPQVPMASSWASPAPTLPKVLPGTLTVVKGPDGRPITISRPAPTLG